VVAFDNVSCLQNWLSDALCRLSTGGGFATRRLFSDQEETILEAQRPVILNGIEVAVTRPDLLDRAIVICLPPIPESARRSEEKLQREFLTLQPRILGALLDAVAGALRRLPSIQLARRPRMADFAEWATAAEEGLGLAPGAFMKAYDANRQAANDLALESSPVAEALFKLVELEPWTGTAAELLGQLATQVEERIQKQKSWPSSARGIRGLLERLVPNLRAAGVEVTFLPRQGRGRQIRIERIGIEPSPPSPPSPDLLSSLDADPAPRPSGDGAGDGVPDQLTNDPGRPSPATASGEGASDGGDGGDGRSGALSPADNYLDQAQEPQERPETPGRPSGAASEGCGGLGAEEPSP
jgi:hypothetical protein